ncbi:glycosyltransferase family 2 protein [Desulfosediminicola flagellatus]|uniref:glycosyltransferase family 2 protein n=1 Tax=Desulfosediminicola flagellatus TaxID=2569541 RepID=UPI0010ABC5C7|nr:glycosyltransferase family 2 protein [Desulfosediminicola flagellatus]
MYKTIRKFILQKYNWAKEIYPFYKEAYRASKEMVLKQDNRRNIKPSDILLFCTMKNEAHRLEYFLNYYRKLGVNHFLFVDNNSTDNTAELLESYNDVTRFHTEGSYKNSNFGMHWLNYLLFTYGRDHWCLTCDPDEFIIYPHMETRDLYDLTQYLSSIRQDSFFTVMTDMYSKLPVSETVYVPGTNPLNTCQYFDKNGYTKKYNPDMRNLYVQGGVRRRIFSCNTPDSAPALNKIPLIKWKWNYIYTSSMHMALPRRLNNCIDARTITGALLHFKFISELDKKVKYELHAKQHYNDSAEYKQYGQIIDNNDRLYHPAVSTHFENWRTLTKIGLINQGEW